MGELLIRLTAQLLVVCYLGRVSCDFLYFRSKSMNLGNWSRLIWTTGLLFLLAHLIFAFEFKHHWSHEAAVRHTANQTELITGWNWGGGLYINYLFVVYCYVEVLLWWFWGSQALYRGLWYQGSVHLLLVFFFFNATIVFGPNYWRFIGMSVLVAVIVFRWTYRLLVPKSG